MIRHVGPAPRIARCDSAEGLRKRLGEVARPVQEQPAPCSRLRLAHESVAELRRGLRADARHVLEALARDRLAQLLGRARAEGAADRDGTLRRKAEEAPETDELRLDLSLELPRVRDLSRLDELAQAGFEPRPDPAELAHAPVSHELGDGCGQRPDHVGGAPIRADDVVRRACEVEQRRVPLERIGDRRVVEG